MNKIAPFARLDTGGGAKPAVGDRCRLEYEDTFIDSLLKFKPRLYQKQAD